MSAGSRLKISGLSAGYGQRLVIHNIDLIVEAGEIALLVGPNGAGKSTIVNVISGLIPAASGTLEFDGVPLDRFGRHSYIGTRISVVPQWARVFPGMSVDDNLRVGGLRLNRRELNDRVAEVYGLFPFLKDRLDSDASTLSGGEQQMLALARALVPRPSLLVVDEPSVGLAPQMVHRFFDSISNMNQRDGLSVLLAEQRAEDALAISHRTYGMKFGRICMPVWSDNWGGRCG